MLTPGFHFNETMAGSYYKLGEPTVERPLEFTIRVETRDLKAFFRDRIWRIEGEISAEGIASAKPLSGTLDFKLPDEKRLVYRFSFRGDNGTEYEFFGQKDWMPIAPIRTISTLPGSLYAGGEEIARAVVRFDMKRDLFKFLGSFRPSLS